VNAIHLCCGAGGITLGFEQAGIESRYAFDISPMAVATHQTNFPLGTCEVHDIRDLHGRDLPLADVWTCGIPCEPFSVAGRRLEHQDDRDISTELARLLHESEGADRGARFVFLENVPLYRNSLGAQCIKEALRGWAIWESVVAHADYGICQKRQRWHLIAYRDGNVLVPQPTHAEQADMFGRSAWVRFGEIRERPVDDPHYMSARALRGIIRRQRSKTLSGLALDRGVFSTIYVVDDEDMMPTVLSSWYHGISGNQAAVVFDDFRFRMPTWSETMRAQGFPETFEFCGTMRERYEQLGRAVPPPFARAVGEALLDTNGAPREMIRDSVLAMPCL